MTGVLPLLVRPKGKTIRRSGDAGDQPGCGAAEALSVEGIRAKCAESGGPGAAAAPVAGPIFTLRHAVISCLMVPGGDRFVMQLLRLAFGERHQGSDADLPGRLKGSLRRI
jgi:hypothetical protein